MGQSIRYCKEKDINNLTNIIDEQLTETNQLGDKELIFKNLKKMVLNPNYNIVILCDQKNIVGGSIVNLTKPFWRDVTYGSISWFFILKKYRNFLNAKKLLRASENWLKTRGVKWIETDVWHIDKNLKINQFYINRFKIFLTKLNKYKECGNRLIKYE
jgi:GNAT superfamily N-acetyltransferase